MLRAGGFDTAEKVIAAGRGTTARAARLRPGHGGRRRGRGEGRAGRARTRRRRPNAPDAARDAGPDEPDDRRNVDVRSHIWPLSGFTRSPNCWVWRARRRWICSRKKRHRREERVELHRGDRRAAVRRAPGAEAEHLAAARSVVRRHARGKKPAGKGGKAPEPPKPAPAVLRPRLVKAVKPADEAAAESATSAEAHAPEAEPVEAVCCGGGRRD